MGSRAWEACRFQDSSSYPVADRVLVYAKAPGRFSHREIPRFHVVHGIYLSSPDAFLPDVDSRHSLRFREITDRRRWSLQTTGASTTRSPR